MEQRVSQVCTGTFEKKYDSNEKGLSILYSALFLISCTSAKDGQIDLASFSSYVNPFIGATTNTEAAGSYHGLGKTFPGATAPFGMVQVSPNTVTGGIMEVVTAMNIRLLKDSLLHKCRELVGMAI